jgi:phospholipid/cholesterol/gamma-HCH transport system substrate-binding protein
LKLAKEIKVGVTFIAATALLVWGINFLKGTELFRNQTNIYAVYPQIEGLKKSNPVAINGLAVGIVEDIYFQEGNSGLIVVKMLITSKFPIPKNSVARIHSSDLMGSKAIDIKLGNSPTMVKSGDMLDSEVEASLKDEVNRQVLPLKRKAEDMISSFDSVLTNLQAVFNDKTKSDIASSFESIRITLNNLQSTTSNIDTLVKVQKGRLSVILANVESISTNLKANNQNISRIMANFSQMSDSLAKLNVGKTFGKLDKSLGQISTILGKIDQGDGSLGLLLNNDSLYKNLNQSANDLDLLLKDLKENPKRYVRFSVF